MKKTGVRFGSILLAILILPACASFNTEKTSPSPATHPASQESHVDTAFLLGYFQRISKLPPDDLKNEYRWVETAFAKQKSPRNRLQLVMLLSLPKAPFADSERAAALMRDRAADASIKDENLIEFMRFLEAMLNEKNRQDTRLDALKMDSRRLNDRNEALLGERRKLDDRLDQLDQKWKAEQRRADLAERQLQAVKNMEKSLNQRWAGKK